MNAYLLRGKAVRWDIKVPGGHVPVRSCPLSSPKKKKAFPMQRTRPLRSPIPVNCLHFVCPPPFLTKLCPTYRNPITVLRGVAKKSVGKNSTLNTTAQREKGKQLLKRTALSFVT